MITVAASIKEILSTHVSSITLRSVIYRLGPVQAAPVATLEDHDRQRIFEHLQASLELFAVQNKAMLLSRYRQYLDQSYVRPSVYNKANAVSQGENA